MKIKKFDIHNFKGIRHTTIDVAGVVPGNIGTLIGLNESGKTTILEALSHFVTQDRSAASLVSTVHQPSSLQDLIPKASKAAFTGDISIVATVSLEDTDVTALADHYKEKTKLILDKSYVNKNILVRRIYTFEDSIHKRTQTVWTINDFKLRPHKSRSYKSYGGSEETKKEEKDIWLQGVNFLSDRIPQIVYFPTFLFDFPNRVYLEGESTDINSYYKSILQDVLDCQGEGISIRKHVLDRVERIRLRHTEPANFITAFMNSSEKDQIDAVMLKIAMEMSRVIFGSWNEVLGKNVTGKRVHIDWKMDPSKSNALYVEISIVDNHSRYTLSERSLGFRWFFSFLLFTQFRQYRKDKSTIFLLDEPASNLHSKAQNKLLESFSNVANSSIYIIYSTHSHYMVNPLWLEKAYIVRNTAIDYDSENDIDSFEVKNTNIEAIPYRSFVNSNPTKTTYFQPVLDALDFAFSPLERSSNALIVEGKFDYYPLLYLRRRTSTHSVPEIFPANGAGGIGTLISLFRGWAVKFRILLDDDEAGQREKKRYVKDYLLAAEEVATLGDVVPTLKGATFEGIYQKDVTDAVRSEFKTATALSKGQYALHFQRLIHTGAAVSYPRTEAIFKPLSDWIDKQFA